MTKIDLKDAYLTILIAQEHQCLLSSQIGVGKMGTIPISPIRALYHTIPILKGNKATDH